MLSSNELALYNIISDESKTFEQIGQSFQKAYSKIEQFKVGVTLWFLIKENLFNLNQRLASFYILYDMYNNEKISSNPFMPIILETLQSTQNKFEKKFLIDCVNNSISYQKESIKTFKEEREIEEIPTPELSEYWDEYNKSIEKFGKNVNDWIRPIIYDKKNNENKNLENIPPFDVSQLTPEEVSFNYFEPNYLTYYPNSNYPFLEDEPMWIMPTLNYDFIWDFTMTPEQDNLCSILNKPIHDKNVTEEQINYALELIEKNPNILKEINFGPENLMKLIEKNVPFSGDILLKISKNDTLLIE